ncbi:transporter family-2 protein [Tumebacillus sp. BK434]|uniref:DMT family transporter n=1 Tax=Tumebacillus sp. BK434 TaxID=2512169 RepID=UPI00104C50F1|nr:DMT family transporter [Tumebacillus sp. BK434]TCP57910.1 transporter family-2 protein [Tumebacillus sp. BK434]
MSSGLLLALVAGALVGLQNIFNSKVSERAGTWVTTAWVLGMGALASLLIGLALEGRALFVLENPKPWHWVSGLLGVGVVTSLVQGVRRLGATYAVSIALTSQLLCAVLWDSLGWFGLEQVPFTGRQLIGVLVIIGGVLVYKGGAKQVEQV